MISRVLTGSHPGPRRPGSLVWREGVDVVAGHGGPGTGRWGSGRKWGPATPLIGELAGPTAGVADYWVCSVGNAWAVSDWLLPEAATNSIPSTCMNVTAACRQRTHGHRRNRCIGLAS